MTKVEAVLRVLFEAKHGLSARMIFNAIEKYVESYDIHVLSVLVSQMAIRGYLIKDGRVECEHCGVSGKCYRISDAGRMRLQELRKEI